jgi:hypothetical protein
MELLNCIPDGWQVQPQATGLRLVAPARKAILPFLENWLEELRCGADRLGCVVELCSLDSEKVIAVKPRGKTPMKPMAVITAASVGQVYSSPMLPTTKPLMRTMERMIDSDRPMFLLSNEDDQQLWINQLAADMIQSSGADAVQRCIRDYWNAPDLEDLHKKLRDTSAPFDHPYSAILNDEQSDVWFSAVSRYEPVEIGGKSYRLSVNKHFQIIGRAALTTFR